MCVLKANLIKSYIPVKFVWGLIGPKIKDDFLLDACWNVYWFPEQKKKSLGDINGKHVMDINSYLLFLSHITF